MPVVEGFGAYKSDGDHRFFSYNIRSAQRLPNGNTLITQGQYGRVYRTYRVPYDWIPQLEKPVERAVILPPNNEFRIKPVGSE